MAPHVIPIWPIYVCYVYVCIYIYICVCVCVFFPTLLFTKLCARHNSLVRSWPLFRGLRRNFDPQHAICTKAEWILSGRNVRPGTSNLSAAAFKGDVVRCNSATAHQQGEAAAKRSKSSRQQKAAATQNSVVSFFFCLFG